MTAESFPIRIRNINEEDIGFVFNSWLQSCRQTNFAKDIRNEIYYANHHKLIEKIISRGFNYIACNNDDPGQIYGYIVGENVDGFLVVHFMYVKHVFRGLGVGKLLLEKAGHDISTASLYTHDTKAGSKLSAKYNFVYHPYLALQEPEKKIEKELTEKKPEEESKD